MPFNPFIAFFHDPVGVLAAVGYTIFLLALTAWTLAVIANVATRGWTHVVWLYQAWDWRGNDEAYGPEWDLSLPPKPVAHRVSLVGLHAGAALFLLAVDAWAIAAIIYVVSP